MWYGALFIHIFIFRRFLSFLYTDPRTHFSLSLFLGILWVLFVFKNAISLSLIIFYSLPMLACGKTFDLSMSILLAASALNSLIKSNSWGFILLDSLSMLGIKSYHLQTIKFCLFLSNNLNLVSVSSLIALVTNWERHQIIMVMVGVLSSIHGSNEKASGVSSFWFSQLEPSNLPCAHFLSLYSYYRQLKIILI